MPLKILLLADVTHPTAAVYDHINAITAHSRNEWTVINPLSCRVLHKIDFNRFDAVGLHYSIRPHNPYYVPGPLYQALKRYKGRKFQFIQDEYSQVKLTMDTMADLGISLVYTLVKPDLVRKAYPDPRLSQVEFVTVLTGYIPENLRSFDAPPIKNRTIDIFYRSRALSYWLGDLGQEKITIAQEVQTRTKNSKLNVDVSVNEEDRIYGEEWIKRLSNSKAVLGTESGASIWDFTGEAEKKTREYLQKHPYASYEEVHQKILQPYEGNVMYSAVSPRIFEAAALKTPMIMFPGWYSGVCEADTHYIPLEKDFSNFDEVLKKLNDDEYLQAMADRAYQDLILSGKYIERRLAEAVDESLTPVQGFESQPSEQTPQAHIASVEQEHRLLQYFEWARVELCFAFKNFFRILFDTSIPLSQKANKLRLGAQRYFLYLKPRLMLLFSKERG